MTSTPDARAEAHLALLDELTAIGMDAARAIGRQIRAVAPDETPATAEALASLESLSRAYAKIARAVRLTLLLQDRIARPAPGQADPAYQPITHIVRTIVDPARRGEDGEPIEYPYGESRERLDREAFPGPLQTPAALIAHICQDLGLDAEWSQQAAETWALGEPVTAAPGWPLRSIDPDSPLWVQHE